MDHTSAASDENTSIDYTWIYQRELDEAVPEA